MRRIGSGLRVFLAVQAVLVAGSSRAGTPPPGFSETVLVTGGAGGVSQATAIAYEPGTGHLWIAEKGGRVRVRDAGTGLLSTALTIAGIDSAGERGLLGLAFDPLYDDGTAVNRWVYLYYTPTAGGTHNRVSRFRESGGTLSGERVLLEGPTLSGATNHNGGCLRFGADRTLYISMGDNDTDRPGQSQWSQDLGDLRGKILRINPDGTIPGDNPFVGQAGILPAIWAYGLRNPWRFDIDPATDTLYIGDVGEVTYESIYRGIRGANHGYPCWEGPIPGPGSNSLPNCSPGPAAGTVTFPIYFYGHGAQTLPVQGNSLTGGMVYRATAFPPEYQDNYYFADYGAGWIRRARIEPDGQLTGVEMFVSSVRQVVDMTVSPTGCLVHASLGTDGIREVCHVGGGNGQPEAVAAAVPQAGLAPLDVQFTGSDSSDPDGDPLLYDWDFGDANRSAVADPLHRYTANGVYQVLLTVDDQRGAANSSDVAPPIRIVVGNEPPVPTITAPSAGTTYSAGDTIAFSGTGQDPQEGVLAAARFTWTVVFHHDAHEHPFLGPIRGVTSGQFTVPTVGEDSPDTFFRIHLSVADTGVPLGPNFALASSTTVDVRPIVSVVTLEASPAVPGLELAFDGEALLVPASWRSVANWPRTIAAPSPQVVGGRTYAFRSWSDGGAAQHVVDTPATDTTYTAFFDCVAGCEDCTNGIDDDGDGAVDCPDTDCCGHPACLIETDCCNGLDDDCDLMVDLDDSDCNSVPGCDETGLCADGLDNDGDGLTDCADFDCRGDAACPEAGNCTDGIDNDLSGEADCDDSACVDDPACAALDFDGDTLPNGLDCEPRDPGAFRVPAEVPRLDVAKDPAAAPLGVILSWTSLAAQAGQDLLHDVAGDLLSVLHLRRVADGACLLTDVAGTQAQEGRAVADDGWYYLVRARNVCGDGVWGDDSRGSPRPACP